MTASTTPRTLVFNLNVFTDVATRPVLRRVSQEHLHHLAAWSVSLAQRAQNVHPMHLVLMSHVGMAPIQIQLDGLSV